MENEADERASIEAYRTHDIDAEQRKGSGANKRRRERKQFLYKRKSVPCQDCGVRYPPYVMDFDHVRGDKVMDISDMISAAVSWDVLIAEVAKCEVVCANCHRIRTYTRGLDSFEPVCL